MLKRLDITNFTCFAHAQLDFGRNLNVFVGENGTGKTHLLKLAYTLPAASAEQARKAVGAPTKSALQSLWADKLVNVFRPETLGRLARRGQGRRRCEVGLTFAEQSLDSAFSFATNSKSEVSVETAPAQWLDAAPVYLPTRELLTIYPNFVAVYEQHYLELEETWRDTAVLLGGLLQRGPREYRIRRLLEPLETAMQGSIELDNNGRFYLRNASGRMEMPLVAEGLRKLAMLARLIATGTLLDKGALFWDEPDANLNPRLIKCIARSICDLAGSGIQVFIATHSLFLLREIEILTAAATRKPLHTRYFGLHTGADGVQIQQGPNVDDIGDIAALDEELAQSDRFLAANAS
jgi:predicted ATPase